MLYNVDIENLLNGVKMMELLKKRIVSDGVIMGTDIVKVDGFLNHRVDQTPEQVQAQCFLKDQPLQSDR